MKFLFLLSVAVLATPILASEEIQGSLQLFNTDNGKTFDLYVGQTFGKKVEVNLRHHYVHPWLVKESGDFLINTTYSESGGAFFSFLAGEKDIGRRSVVLQRRTNPPQELTFSFEVKRMDIAHGGVTDPSCPMGVLLYQGRCDFNRADPDQPVPPCLPGRMFSRHAGRCVVTEWSLDGRPLTAPDCLCPRGQIWSAHGCEQAPPVDLEYYMVQYGFPTAAYCGCDHQTYYVGLNGEGVNGRVRTYRLGACEWK